jgi:hypothetical protein
MHNWPLAVFYVALLLGVLAFVSVTLWRLWRPRPPTGITIHHDVPRNKVYITATLTNEEIERSFKSFATAMRNVQKAVGMTMAQFAKLAKRLVPMLLWLAPELTWCWPHRAPTATIVDWERDGLLTEARPWASWRVG